MTSFYQYSPFSDISVILYLNELSSRQDSSLESNKNNTLCSTLLCILILLLCTLIHTTPPLLHLYSTTLFFFLNLKLTDTRFFKARAQHISWGHAHHCSITLRHSVIAPSHSVTLWHSIQLHIPPLSSDVFDILRQFNSISFYSKSISKVLNCVYPSPHRLPVCHIVLASLY